MDLKGRVALVTGAGKGIGKGIAIDLATHGAHVAINYHSSEEGALLTKSQVESLGSEALAIKADVSKKDQVVTMVEETIARFGKIDILVNNSALQTHMGIFEYDEPTYDLIMNVNLKGYFLCIQAVAPYMKSQGFGRIINISSVHGKRPTDFDVVYAMTKGGIKMLTREAAIELAPYGITVNTIEPGAVSIGKKSGNPRPIRPRRERKPSAFSRFPMGRVGKPEDVGHLVSFLASDDSEFITGSSIRLDGASMLL